MESRFAFVPRLLAVAALGLAACSSGAGAPSPSVQHSGRESAIPASTSSLAVSSPVDVSSLTGRITFSSGIDDVYVVKANGSGLRRLTNNPARDFDSAWSPDGRMIAFRSERDGNTEIYVMAADGSGQRNLSRDPSGDWGPTWTPDGQVAWNCARGLSFGFRACVERPNGSGLRMIPADTYVEYMDWSRDGTKVVFMSQEPGASGSDPDYNIYTMNADGSDIRRLTTTPGEDGWPSWSPDGRQIAYATSRDDCRNSKAAGCLRTGDIGPFFDLWVMNADGSNQHRVTKEMAQFMDWSPDGRYLVFSPGLNIIRPDGTGLARIPAATGGALFLDWTP
jgi:Tol biopolymer transport system component